MRRQPITVESIVAQGCLPRTTRVGHRREGTSLELGHYLGLDRTGARIWQLLEQPREVSSVCAQVSQEFGYEREACTREVIAYLGTLVRDRIVRIVA